MEDVVLHYRPGSSDGLSSLLERTENLLEPFPCRTPPVFTPWFPAAAAAAARHLLPIRPAKPAPVITSSGDLLVSHRRPVTKPHPESPDRRVAQRHRPRADAPPESPQLNKDAVCVSETPNHLLLLPAGQITNPSPGQQPRTDKDGVPVAGSPVKRSWSVSARRGARPQSSQSLSKHFGHTVSVHRLHLRQRAKWVIGEHNCGAARDIEQVWRTLSRSVSAPGLPTCNANIQRERAEIWVFCDVVQSEQVGRFLKAELQLSGRINLSVHRLGNIFSM